MLTVEDWGLGMPPLAMVEANGVLAEPREVDLSASQRLGFHVVSRLAHRLGIRVWLTPTADSGVTAVVALPAGLFPSGPQREPGTTSARTPSGVHGPGLPRRVPQATRTGANVSASAVTEPAASAVTEPRQAPQWPGRPPAPPYSPEPTRPASAGESSPVLGGRPGPGPVAAVEPPNPAAASAEPAAPAEHESPLGGPQPPGARGSAPASGVVLSRRTPQTHLAPQLRASGGTAVASAVPDPERTRDALSRYQASRREALSKGVVAAGHGVGLDDAGQTP